MVHSLRSRTHLLGPPYTAIGTPDGGARPHTIHRYEYSAHLLGYWVWEQQIMSLEDVLYRYFALITPKIP